MVSPWLLLGKGRHGCSARSRPIIHPLRWLPAAQWRSQWGPLHSASNGPAERSNGPIRSQYFVLLLNAEPIPTVNYATSFTASLLSSQSITFTERMHTLLNLPLTSSMNSSHAFIDHPLPSPLREALLPAIPTSSS